MIVRDKQKRKLICVPAYFHPCDPLTVTRCKIIPGVKIVKIAGGLKQAVLSSSERLPREPEFAITHAICIEEDEYMESLKNRLALEGRQLSDPFPSGDRFVDYPGIAKQAVLSLILSGGVRFSFQGAHFFSIQTKGQKVSYTPTAYSHGPLCQLSQYMRNAGVMQVSKNGSIPINPRKVRAIANIIDRYFRTDRWWWDRISMALGFFWDALCTPSPQLSFLGLTASLESLLSTQTMEITHILAERVAVLTQTTPSGRLEAYRQIKDLYKTRSKIVHGKVNIRKGILNAESLFVSAKMSNVPLSALRSLTSITITVIKAVLENKELRIMIQTKGAEDKINKKVDAFFLNALFRK